MKSLKKQEFRDLNVVALAGGVGGAKLARGLNLLLEPERLVVVVNTGDDFDHLGLQICPDLDSVCYGMAGLNDPLRGWGLEGETWTVFEQLKLLGGPDWFQLGDKDLATHLMRTQLLKEGKTLTEATAILCASWGIKARVLPMSDCPSPTKVRLKDHRVLAFQEYFVKEACQPEIEGILLPEPESAISTNQVLEALAACDLVVFCPSNPWLSIDPILNFPAIRKVVASKPVVAVSPFIGGKAVKGPAAKMAAELGHGTEAEALLEHYYSLVGALLFDLQDTKFPAQLERQGIIFERSDTLMKDDQDKRQVAAKALSLGLELVGRCSK
ncbi:MAG TPA: 2-phospho-L-lactate transferase [Anaerolineaceae bacterium]|nr:2-phospho-L-lactate transferase [Anaerolineaceae bacterium]